jgi:two-component system, chemotaxis family, chemotaxis protein CheY
LAIICIINLKKDIDYKGKTLKLLVVDDSSTMRRIIKNTLSRLGYEDVLEGEDGLQGWAALNENTDVGMLITDWNMPEMNGLELVKKVRADARFADLPIIMVTTEGGKAEVITALKAGVNNYIVKPFTPQVLKEKLAAVLGTEG